ncbi:hypothetical protein PRIPAC_88907 [Pristionchus pacificus]|uniref:Uncharacterized protein n=1 Tax=Pristionchus pacificus TaxID=54126 RepID=A0A2A6B8T8_PRIPA|nr:hypothetical protein PRIPAC_88907 [Pristionchus pacificus]|eukprot:PDM62288.1 hypothetical protein PRIPAC_51730 [Pristionchus pacificus]
MKKSALIVWGILIGAGKCSPKIWNRIINSLRIAIPNRLVINSYTIAFRMTNCHFDLDAVRELYGHKLWKAINGCTYALCESTGGNNPRFLVQYPRQQSRCDRGIDAEVASARAGTHGYKSQRLEYSSLHRLIPIWTLPIDILHNVSNGIGQRILNFTTPQVQCPDLNDYRVLNDEKMELMDKWEKAIAKYAFILFGELFFTLKAHAELGSISGRTLLIDASSNNQMLDRATTVAEFQNAMKMLTFGTAAINLLQHLVLFEAPGYRSVFQWSLCSLNITSFPSELQSCTAANEVRRDFPWEEGTTREMVAEFLEVAKDRQPPQIKGKVHSRERVHWRRRKGTNDELEVDMIEMADDSRADLDHDYHMDREENGQHEMSGMNQSNHDVDKRNGNIESIETKPLIPKLFALTNVKVENSMEILDFTQENGNTEHGNTGERNDFIELASIVHDAGFDADAMEFYKPPSSKPPLNLDDISTL